MAQATPPPGRSDVRRASAALAAFALLLVCGVSATIAVPAVREWAAGPAGRATLTAATLLGYGVAVAVLGARQSGASGRRGLRWLPRSLAVAPLTVTLGLTAPGGTSGLLAGVGAWCVLAGALLWTRVASTRAVPWPLRAARFAAPAWLLAVILVVFQFADPGLASAWTLPVIAVTALAALAVIPGILIAESIDALAGGGWIGRFLQPETARRAWLALAVKAAATATLLVQAAIVGDPFVGWTQAAVVAAGVVAILVVESSVPLSGLGGESLGRRLKVAVGGAMGCLCLLTAVAVVLLTARRPATLLGLAALLAVVGYVRPPRTRRALAAAAVVAVTALAAWGWATGPFIPFDIPDLVGAAGFAAGLIAFGVVLVIQVLRAVWQRQAGFPLLVVVVVAVAVAGLATKQSAPVAAVNVLVLPPLALGLLWGRSRRHLVDPGEVIRWCLITLVAIDLPAATAAAPPVVQSTFQAVGFLSLGIAPLALNRRGAPRMRAAGLVTSVFVGIAAMVALVPLVELPEGGLVAILERLTTLFVAMIAFPVSAALSAASAQKIESGPDPVSAADARAG